MATTIRRGVKRNRKQRVVKNAYIDIDAVSDPPGPGYANWIVISRRMLKEREAKLLAIKTEQIERIFNESVRALHPQRDLKLFKMSSERMNQVVLIQLFQNLNTWNGPNLSRIRKQISSFRDYFVIGKNWWDLIKRKSLGDIFWMSAFHQIQASLQIMLSDAESVSKALLVILDRIFSGTVHYANTKIQPLVNNSTLIGSSKMQQYFLKLHPSLNVQRWKLEETLRQRQRSGDLLPPGRPGTVTNSNRGKNIPRLIMAKLRLSLHELASGNPHIDSSVLDGDATLDAVHGLKSLNAMTAITTLPLSGAAGTGLTLPSIKFLDDADSVQLLAMKSPPSMAEPLNILPTMSVPMAPSLSMQTLSHPLPDLDGGGSGGHFSWDMTPSIISEPLPVVTVPTAPSAMKALSMENGEMKLGMKMKMKSIKMKMDLPPGGIVTSGGPVTGNNVVYIRAYSPYRGVSQRASDSRNSPTTALTHQYRYSVGNTDYVIQF